MNGTTCHVYLVFTTAVRAHVECPLVASAGSSGGLRGSRAASDSVPGRSVRGVHASPLLLRECSPDLPSCAMGRCALLTPWNVCAGHRVVGASVRPASGVEAATKEKGPWLLLATSSGHGKRVPLSEFRFTSRLAAGVIGIKLAEGTSIVNVHVVANDESDEADDSVNECLVATSSGMMSRIALEDISVYGRGARGIRIVKLAPSDQLSSVTPCKYRHMAC